MEPDDLPVEARENAQQRRFPAAARTDDAEELAGRDAQIDMIDGDDRALPAGIFAAQARDFDRGAAALRRHGWRSGSARS